MMQLDDDPIPATRIPRVKVLCHTLGLDVSRSKFREAVIAWRRNQKTASGISGMQLTDWSSKRDRYELGVMAQHYLETGGHARKYWPSSGRASSRIRPEYPADMIQIASLLRRLFWRQNDHARKNAKRPSKSNLSDDDSMSAAHSPTIPSSQRSTQRRCQVSKPTQAPQSLSAGKDTLWHAPSDVTSDASTDSTGSSSSDSSDEDSTQDTPLECGSRRPLDLDDKSKADEYGNGHVTQSLIVTLKYKQSRRMELEQSPGDRAPVVRMVTKPAGLLADSPGSPSRSHPGNASAAQTGSPLNASPGSNDDDPEEEEEEDEDYVPRRGSRRKRRHSSRSDATRCAGRSKKRRHTSKSPKLGSAGSSTMVGEEEDSDETPVVPTSVHKSWRSTNVAYMTVDASKANYDSGGADTSSSNTFPSGPPDASAFDLEDPIQRRNNHARTFPSEDTTYRAHDTLPLSPTSDVVDSRNANDQRTHARDSTEFVDSRRSLMQASPSRPDFSPATRAREDSSEPADKPGVEIFVLLRGTMKHWNTTLSDKKLKTISDHVSRVTSRNEIQRIGFYLETLKEKNDLEYFIERGDTAVFKAVIRKFNKRMDKCKDAGEDSFEIHLDPDPEQHNAEKAKVAQVSKRDGQRW